VAQVDHDGYALKPGLGFLDLEIGFAEGHVQRHRRTRLTFAQGVVLHHGIGQHGDLVARHVDGGQASAADLVDGTARLHGQTGRGDVDAHGDGATAQALQREGIVDFGGVRVVNGERLHIGQRQFVGDGRGLQLREARAFGKPLEQESLPVEVPGRVDRAGLLKQVQWRLLAGLAGFDHGLVFGGVLVGPEQDLVELLAHGRGALAMDQLL